MSRPDPALPLLYGGDIRPGRHGYTDAERLQAAFRGGLFSQSWWLGPQIVSGQVRGDAGGGVWKRTDRLQTDAPGLLLPRLERAGARHPSSYTDAFHQIAPRVPLVKFSRNGLFNWWSGGAWSEARQVGIFPGTWYRYDLRSAYRWAASLGLPDMTTGQSRRRWTDRPGLWVGEFRGDTRHLPPVYRAGGLVVASAEDLDAWRVPFTARRGFTWERTLPSDWVDRTLDKLPCAKESGRTFWGRWIGKTPLTIKSSKGAREMPRNIFANFVWGWMIVHRVRLRVWQYAAEAVHVHVDEIVVPHAIDTGPDVPGAWREKAVYPDGVNVIRTGHWGPRVGPATMQTGVKRHVA